MARPTKTTPNDFTEQFFSILHESDHLPRWLDDTLTGALRATTSTTQTQSLSRKLALGMLSSLPEITTKSVKEYIEARYPITTRTAQLYVSCLRVVLNTASKYLAAQVTQ